jgi:hypothetical protein
MKARYKMFCIEYRNHCDLRLRSSHHHFSYFLYMIQDTVAASLPFGGWDRLKPAVQPRATTSIWILTWLICMLPGVLGSNPL